MRPSEIGTASLLQAMMRLTLLLRPVLSSDSNLRYGSGIQIQMLLNKPKESSNAGNTENPAYNPKRFLCNTQTQDINLKNIYTYKPNTFFCETCGNTDADGCILTRLGKDICHSILSNEHNKASECFSEYSEALKNHKKMPPNFPGDYIKICWEPFLRFIEILTADKDNRNALIDVLQKYRDLPPFLLKNIVIADAGFLVHEGVTKSNEKKHEKKLGGCNLREISLLYKRYALHDCQGDKSMQEVEAYNDILATILFYSPSLQKLTNLKKKLHIDYNIGREKETSKIVDFKQFLTKKFISASVLEYLDPSSYEDDEFIFEAFRRAAQEVIDKECTITSAWYLLRWCEFFYWHKTIEKALNQNFQITFERLAKYVKNIDYKREKEDDKRIKEKSEREEKKWKRNEEKKERREEIDINEDKHMMNKNHPWRHPDLEILMRETNSIFPFKLENIIVSCSDFSKAEGPLFEKVRDSNRGNTGHKKISECSLLEFKFLCQLYELDEPKGKTREQGYHYWLTVKPIIKNYFGIMCVKEILHHLKQTIS